MKYTPSRWRIENEAKKDEKRDVALLAIFGVITIGYFSAHLLAYLITN